jgi:hypothetical protein
MAANGDAQNDLKAHQETYSGFLGLMKYGTIASAIVAAIVVLLIASHSGH